MTKVVGSICFAGIVGPPMTNCHIKLVDIPEMDYYAKDNKGEVSIYNNASKKYSKISLCLSLSDI
jgi:hypothetical protein